MSMLKKFFAQKPKVEERKTRRGKVQEETTQLENVQEEADFDWETATKEEKAVKYKTDYAFGDAKCLYEVLGNKEAVIRTIEAEKIGGGKWEYVIVELYGLLNAVDKASAKILKDAYFDIAKLGDFSVLWEGFPNHQQLVRWENVREFVDLLVEDVADFELNIGDVAAELQRRVQTQTEAKSASVVSTTAPQTTPTQPIAKEQEVEIVKAEKVEVVAAEKVAPTPAESQVIEGQYEEVPSKKENEKSEDYYETLTKEIFESESATVA